MADKRELAAIMTDIAALLEMKGDNPFKIRAYQGAARFLEQYDGDLENLIASGGLDHTKGIGPALAAKIREYAATGTVAYYEELKAGIPPVLHDMVKIPGLGPKKALQLIDKLGIDSLRELEYACHENRLIDLPGFGAKTQEKILQGLELLKKFQGRFLLGEAWPLAEAIAEYLARLPAVSAAEVAGSVRRRLEVVHDVDIVVASTEPEAVAASIAAMPGVTGLLGSGLTKTSVMLDMGMQVDVRVVTPAQYAAALHHFTGSREHHIELRRSAKQQGIKINDYGLETVSGAELDIRSERDIYEILGYRYIEPELREGAGELERAAQGELPELLSERDLQGVLHVHSLYSDGSNSLPELAAGARQRGWSYLGLTDHSQTAAYARGLKREVVLRQRREIDEWNAEHPELMILAGIESDILPDGSLDYPDEVLASFDFVIASVHSAFRQSEADMTRRIIRAVQNPFVSVLGHVTGRILLARDGYALNMEDVLKAAADSGTMVEINASPYRLDLDWRWHGRARELGIMLAISPDAHAVGDFDNVRFGVAVARKGWLTAADIVNTRPTAEALALLRRKRG